jgi:hypothetical protein
MSEKQSLSNAATHLIALRKQSPDRPVWNKAIDDFHQALAEVSNGDEILKVLTDDVNDDLPIEEKTAAFQKLLASGGYRTPEVLRSFADHLWLHGPDDDELVEKLREEADSLDQSNN